jgi:hypothetical protein
MALAAAVRALNCKFILLLGALALGDVELDALRADDFSIHVQHRKLHDMHELFLAIGQLILFIQFNGQAGSA